MKYCTKCGCPGNDADLFCHKCGNRFEAQEVEQTVVENTPQTQQQNYNNQQQNYNNQQQVPADNKKTTMAILALVFSILAVVMHICCFAIGFLILFALGFSITGLVLGIKSRKSGLGLAGMIISIIDLSLVAITILIVLCVVGYYFFFYALVY